MVLPDLLFKYKALNTKEDLIRIIDILKNNRLYLPTRKQLNDPFECVSVSPAAEGVMGSGIMYAADEEPAFWENGRDEYKILAMSEECFSPQMWAYYCSDYSGICLGFLSNNSFSTARPVRYTDEQYTYTNGDLYGPDLVLKSVEKGLLIKQQEWSHEKEWRIISNRNIQYYTYDEKDLMCIIVGYRMNDETKAFIKNIVPSRVPLLIARPGMISYRLYLQPIDYEHPYDGSERPEITSIQELLEYCKGCNKEQWKRSKNRMHP